MCFVLQPWQLLLVILAGCLNRQQQQVIEYLRAENQVLKEKVCKEADSAYRRPVSPPFGCLITHSGGQMSCHLGRLSLLGTD